MNKLLFRLSLVGWASAGISRVLTDGLDTDIACQPDEWEPSRQFLFHYSRSEWFRSQYHLTRASYWWRHMDEPQRIEANGRHQCYYNKPLQLSDRFTSYNERKVKRLLDSR